MLAVKDRQSGWKCDGDIPSTPVCVHGNKSTWEGVTCEDGAIVKIRISHKSLHGELPASIGDMQTLRYLSLFHTNIQGSIPASIGSLRNLEYLSLQGNHFTGSLPDTIGQLSNLKELWLASNQLSGSIPSTIGKLSKITYISLSNNVFSGEIPRSVGQLKALKTFHLDNNNLSGVVPESVCEAPLLSAMYLYFAQKKNMYGFYGEEMIHNNEGLTCYASCLSSVKDKRFGLLPVCTAKELRSATSMMPSIGIADLSALYVSVFHPGLDFIMRMSSSGPSSGTVLLELPNILASFVISLPRQLKSGYFRVKRAIIINLWNFVYGSNKKQEHSGRRGGTKPDAGTGTRKRRSTSGIFFYRRSVGATVAVASSLAIIAGAISFSIASFLFPSTSMRVPLSLTPGAHDTAAAAA
eukprot:CAMPEP_0182416316 /NCGR_PEP_ID=MMETSP1167-20130531/582_1 /TAXON_ID=2988 /ORGANISM="Mallomonas Sp, Strain CCMP3275" /LENGTH=409 /DNA_ID=CAMNT_0024588969 /DNA_START=232 /DNA_END=1461 /DNA_ORIENTATION=+